jgi:hypothetical protein
MGPARPSSTARAIWAGRASIRRGTSPSADGTNWVCISIGRKTRPRATSSSGGTAWWSWIRMSRRRGRRASTSPSRESIATPMPNRSTRFISMTSSAPQRSRRSRFRGRVRPSRRHHSCRGSRRSRSIISSSSTPIPSIPLSTRLIRAKARAAVHGVWESAWLLPLLWALGLACGVVLPLGVLLAAIDLLLVIWFNLALGLYLGIRPGATRAASSRAAMSTLSLFVFHASMLWVVLVSPREIVALDAPKRWGLLAGALIIAFPTGMVAWISSQRTIERFDEWVGRPYIGDRAKRIDVDHEPP